MGCPVAKATMNASWEPSPLREYIGSNLVSKNEFEFIPQKILLEALRGIMYCMSGNQTLFDNQWQT
jgi:hypothetical protein